ncbi:cell division protein FtsZ, partial [Cribrihabitans sp. XS_ASV171]
ETVTEAPAPLPLTEPAPSYVAQAAEEPSLFESMNVEEAAAQDLGEDIFDEEPELMDEDGLPPPAYQPQLAAFEPRQDTMDSPAESFVAPRAPAPGTPSPEAMQRLQTAVRNAPRSQGQGQPAPQSRPAPQPAQP